MSSSEWFCLLQRLQSSWGEIVKDANEGPYLSLSRTEMTGMKNKHWDKTHYKVFKTTAVAHYEMLLRSANTWAAQTLIHTKACSEKLLLAKATAYNSKVLC